MQHGKGMIEEKYLHILIKLCGGLIDDNGLIINLDRAFPRKTGFVTPALCLC